MDTDEGTWGTVVARLGSLASDERPNVRCNLAMLAGALAPTDRRAFDELVDIALNSINRLLREEAPAEEDVLETVVDEREALPDTCKARFDATVGANLAETDRARLAGGDPAIEGVLRLPQRALHLLPPQVIASAILSDARRLAAELTRTDDVFGRERRLSRLFRVSRFFESSLPAIREDIQRCLAKGIEGLSSTERRAVVLALLLSAPRLLERDRAGRHPVAIGTLCGSARRVRPKMLPLIGLSIVRGLVPAACLTGLMALKIGMGGSLGRSGDNIPVSVIELGVLAFVAAWLTGLAFVPSVSRFLAGPYFRATNIGAAVVGALCTFILSGFFIELIYNQIVAAWCWSGVELLAVLIPTVSMAAPAVQFFQGRYTEYRWILMVACVTGPGIVLATAIAAYAGLTHNGVLGPAWPEAIVCTFSVAFTVVSLENAAWTASPADVVRPQAPRWRWIVLGAIAAPEILLAVGLIRAAIDRGAIHPQALVVPRAGAEPTSKVLSIRPNRRVELRLQGGPPPVRIGIDSGSSPERVRAASGVLEPAPGIAASVTSNERQFVLRATTNSVCLNTCGPTWPPMDQWLAVFWGGSSPPVPLTVRVFSRINTTPSNGSESLVVSNGTVKPVAFTTPGVRKLTLLEPSHVILRVSGTGKFGSAPSLAGFWSENGAEGSFKEFFPASDPNVESVDPRPGDSLDFDLPQGIYPICVYFGGADLYGCLPDSPNATPMLFESGAATLSGTVEPLHYALGDVQADVSSDGNTEMSFTTALNRPVPLTIPIANAVSLAAVQPQKRTSRNLQLEINNDDGEAPGLSLSNAHGHVEATGTLDAGRYTICINDGGPCGNGPAGAPVIIKVSFLRPFNQITQRR